MSEAVLESAWAKFYWGKSHMERLCYEIAGFIERNSRAFRTEFDGQRYLVYPRHEAIPVEWPLVLGDAIHSIRGALDQAAWAMVVLENNGPPTDPREQREIRFPLCQSDRDLEGTTTYGHLGPYSRAIVRDAQPYPGGDFHPLRILSKLSNEDKHRLMLSNAVALESGILDLYIGRNDDILHTTEPTFLLTAGDRLTNETPIAHFGAVVSGENPEVDVQGYVPTRIEFSSPEISIKETTLPTMGEYVELVLQRFQLLLQGRLPQL